MNIWFVIGLVAGVQLRRGSQDDLALCPSPFGAVGSGPNAPSRVRRHASVVLLRRSLAETGGVQANSSLSQPSLAVWNSTKQGIFSVFLFCLIWICMPLDLHWSSSVCLKSSPWQYKAWSKLSRLSPWKLWNSSCMDGVLCLTVCKSRLTVWVQWAGALSCEFSNHQILLYLPFTKLCITDVLTCIVFHRFA